MNDPLDYSNVGEDFVMDEEERSRRLTNEQIEEINQRVAAAQEQNENVPQESIQSATAEQSQPQETQPQSTDEKKKDEGFWDLSGVGQDLTYFGQPIEETNQQVKERLSAPGQGLIDFGIEALNATTKFLMRGLDVPKIKES